MELGIPRAFDAVGAEFDRGAIERQPQPFARPLRCGGCQVPVVAVRGYERVEALYRLAPLRSHDEGCRYDFDAQVGNLRRRHVGTVEKDGDTFVLVLNLAPDAEKKRLGEAGPSPRSKLDFLRRPAPTLDQTLRAATEIARLLRAFENDPSARSRFRARYGDRVISWDDFCFDAAHDIKRLYNALPGADSAPDYPRALVGRIAHVKPDNKDSPVGHFAVRELGDRRPVTAPDGVPILPVLRVRMGALPEIVRKDQTVVAYGQWRPFSANTGRAHYVQMWLDEHRGAVARLGR